MSDIIFIIDASISMNQLKDDVINQVNNLLNNYKNTKTKISMITFNEDINVIYHREPIDKVNNLEEKNYKVFGLSNINKSIINIINKYKYLDNVLCILITDDKKINDKKIKEIIYSQQEQGWKFKYLYNKLIESPKLLSRSQSDNNISETFNNIINRCYSDSNEYQPMDLIEIDREYSIGFNWNTY